MKAALIHYHGGKFRMADYLIRLFPKHRIYVEPFGGAASVLLRKKPAISEVYNDVDSEIVSVFRVIREQPGELEQALANTVYAREELDLCYARQATDPVEKARRFIVRSHLAISTTGIYSKVGFRANINSKDHFTTAQTFSRIHELVRPIRKRLSNTIIENCHYTDLIGRYDTPETLWYFDPPYHHSTRSKSSVKRGYKHSLNHEEHIELLKAIKSLRGMVIVSGYDTELYNLFLAGWAKYQVDKLTDKWVKRTECVWLNYQAQLDRERLPLFNNETQQACQTVAV